MAEKKQSKTDKRREARAAEVAALGKLDRAARRKSVIANLEKKFGKGVHMTLSAGVVVEVPRITSGSLKLDLALAYRLKDAGYPRGRIVEIIGPETSGKTTLCLMCVAANQAIDPELTADLVDMEHALDPGYARDRLKVDLNRMGISQPDNGEEAMEIIKDFARGNATDITIVDSIAALVPEAELNVPTGQEAPGGQARLMSGGLRSLVTLIPPTQLSLWTNQWRSKVGVIMGDPRVACGGNAMKFYASVRMETLSPDLITVKEDGKDVTIGKYLRVKIIKDKTAVAHVKEVRIPLLFDRGISRGVELADLGLDYGVLEESGAHWISFNGNNIAQGKLNAGLTLDGDLSLAEEIYEALCLKVVKPRELAADNIEHAETVDEREA